MCFYYDGCAEVYEDTHPVARKEHRCCECRGVIAPGEAYHRNFQVTDGDPMTFKECSRCYAVRKRIAEIELSRGCHGSESWCPIGELAEAITEDGDHYGLLRRDGDDDRDFVDSIAAHLFPYAVVMGAVTA